MSRFFQLSHSQREGLMRAWIVLGLVRVGLWFLPFGTLRQMILRHLERRAHKAPKTTVVPAEVAWSVQAAARFVPYSTCLVQALAARILLADSGIPSLVHVGVRRSERGLDAHAWLECRGETCLGARGCDNYTEFPYDRF